MSGGLKSDATYDHIIQDAAALSLLLAGLKRVFASWNISPSLIGVSMFCALLGKLGPLPSSLSFSDYAHICKLVGNKDVVLKELVLYNVPLEEVEAAVASGAALSMLVDMHAVTLPGIKR
jgi:hypothetical protein